LKEERRGREGRRTMVPKVIKPTSEFGGKRLSDMMRESLRACRSSSSRQVSTTKRKMGGTAAPRGRVYSMVVN